MWVIDKISSLKTEASSRLIFLWDAAVSSPRFYFYCEVSLASLEDHHVFALQLSAHTVEAETTGTVTGIGNNGKPDAPEKCTWRSREMYDGPPLLQMGDF